MNRVIRARNVSGHLRAWILKESRQSQCVYPLIHALTAVGREVIGPHVRVFSFERELPVNFVLWFAHGNSVGRQQYRTQQFLLFGT